MRFFKRKPAPEGPFSMAVSMEVAASASRLFSLIDFADENNAKRELGHSVKQMAEDRFELTMSFLPDIPFTIEVEEREVGKRYSFFMPMPEGDGALAWTRETFVIEPTGEASCTVAATVTGEFHPGLTMKEYTAEMTTMGLACENAWGKLKVHAEGGVEEVRAFEAEQALGM